MSSRNLITPCPGRGGAPSPDQDVPEEERREALTALDIRGSTLVRDDLQNLSVLEHRLQAQLPAKSLDILLNIRQAAVTPRLERGELRLRRLHLLRKLLLGYPEQLAKVTERDLLRLDFVVQPGDLCLPLRSRRTTSDACYDSGPASFFPSVARQVERGAEALG
jgi:hypothetical protein